MAAAPAPVASSPLNGAVLVVVDAAGATDAPASGGEVIALCADRNGDLPPVDATRFDLLLTVVPHAPRPWVSVAVAQLDATIGSLRQRAGQQPLAGRVLSRLLRITEHLPFDDALYVESLAYSTLLGGPDFAAWRAARTRPLAATETQAPRVKLERRLDALVLCLSRPARRNAFDARMRDELVDALQFALDDPSAPEVTLTGAGPAFSSGGDLDEFGTTPDVATAHAIRTLQSPARLVHRLRGRVTAHLHGACVGAGIEVPAAAGRVHAAPDSWFCLPELGMGLIPGAGGTATIPRRIGRQRTLYMALTGAPVDARTALEWGLVDAIAARPA
jgi:enoyl-CoA hydratase/carnithine racemase